MSSVQTTLDRAVALDGIAVSHPRLDATRPTRRYLLPTIDLAVATWIVLMVALVIGPMPLRAIGLLPVLWTALLWQAGGYSVPRVAGGWGARPAHVLRAAVVLCAGFWVSATVGWLPARPEKLLLFVGAAAAATMLAHEALGRFGLGGPPCRLVVAGEPHQVQHAVTELRRARRRQTEIVSTCDLDQVVSTAEELGADTVLLLPTDELSPRRLQRLGRQLERISADVYLGTPLLDVGNERTKLVSTAGLRLIEVRPARRRGCCMWAKIAGERILASLALMVLFPVLAVLAALIRLDSTGPVIFRQRRVGLGGREFTMWKFRTMHCNAESALEDLVADNEGAGPLFKLREDPRITRVGAFLRKYSLDELPQLANVVLGDMSVVGPRPPLPDEVSTYDVHTHRRLEIRPGITGLWQVSGRSDLTWEESVRLDLAYVDNWSLRLDLEIVRRTLGAVLRHEGAY